MQTFTSRRAARVQSPSFDFNGVNVAIASFASRIAQLNGVPDATREFNVTPLASQRMRQAIQLSSTFLKAINIMEVGQQIGQSINVGAKTLIGGRTNARAGNVRKPKSVHSLTPDNCECVLTEFDTALEYVDIDAWRHLPNFQQLVAAAIVESIALTRICIGWNGTEVVEQTDATANPLMEDVNKGWIQKVREGKPGAIMSEVVAASSKVKVGAAGDYKNMDAMVLDMRTLLHPNYRDRADLVAICTDTLLHEKYFGIVSASGEQATELTAADMMLSSKRLANHRAATVPFFPAGTVVLTPLSNLSIYEQAGTHRRHIKDMPEVKAVNDFQSVNEAYVVQDLDAIAVVENIELV